MNDHPGAGGPRTADPHPQLRVTALVAVILGVVLLAATAFVFSYPGIRQIALAAGVAPALARIYPMIFDAMLVIAFAAALALRGAGWWTRCFVWLSTLLLLAAVAAGDALRAMGVALPKRPAAAAAAVIPWTLLLLAFWFWLAMLRQFRRSRAVAAAASHGGREAASEGLPPPLGPGALLETRPSAAAPSLGDRVAPASQPGLPAPGAASPAALPAASTQPTASAGPATGEEPGLDEETGDYEHHLLVEEAADFGGPAGDADAGPGDPAGRQGGPGPAGPGHGERGAGGAADGGSQAEEGDSGRPGFAPPLTGQPLSAPPPAQFDRPRSGPTPPQD